MAKLQDDLAHIVRNIASSVGELTGVEASEVERELEPHAQAEGGWLVRFIGSSSQVREAVEQAIGETTVRSTGGTTT